MSSLIIKFPEELFEIAQSSHFTGEWEVDTLVAGPDEYIFSSPLVWDIVVSNADDAFLITGTLKGTARVRCGRCLDDYDIDLAGEIEGLCIQEGSAPPEDVVDEDQDDILILSSNKELDIEPLLRAALLLELPLVPLCRPDCKGLCPQCGHELNESDCGCVQQADAHENPFSILKQLDLD